MATSEGSTSTIATFCPEPRKIDIVNSEAFQTALLERMKASKRLVLDLSKIDFIDSSGLGKIVAALRAYREEGGEMRICGVRPPVQILFSMVRLGEIVGIDPDAESSLRELGGKVPEKAGGAS